MRRLIRLVVLFCGCACLALAAVAGPEPLPSGKEMKEVAPVPTPSCFDWSGFYVGGSGGYKFSSVDLNLDLTGGWNFSSSRDAIKNAGSGNLDNDGGEAGGLVGYNFQWNCWVLGLEADGGYLWARHSTDLVPIPDSVVRSAFRTHYLFTVAPRLGYALGNWLPYISGGLAVGDLEYEQEIDFPPHIPRNFEGSHESQTNAGWMVGGGLQYALTNHWSIRAQYQFIDLGDIDFTSDFAPPTPSSPAHHHAELREHNASFAIMYKF